MYQLHEHAYTNTGIYVTHVQLRVMAATIGRSSIKSLKHISVT